MKKIYFVRHGESELNIGDREQGSEGALSSLGRQQAGFVAQRFISIPIDVIVSSPYQRTKETAEIINMQLNKEIIYSDLLIERKPPTQFIGIPFTDPEYVKARGVMVEHRLVDPSWRYSDEDTFTELKSRAIASLDFLKNLEEEIILAVTHGGILGVIVSVMIFGTELTYAEYLKIYWCFKMKNTGITLAEYDKESSRPRWRLIAWNDHAHL